MCNTSININGAALPAVEHTRDLGVEMCSDLSPATHVGDIVDKGHKRANLIHRAFVCRDLNPTCIPGLCKTPFRIWFNNLVSLYCKRHNCH